MIYGSSMNSVLSLQSSVAKLTEQSNSGRVLTPSDDPVAAARALDLTQSQSVNKQFETNRANAGDLMKANLDTIGNVILVIGDMKSQGINAGNATYSDADRANIATTLKSDFQQMLGYANTTDGLGNFVFAGFKSGTQPFTQDPTTGAVTYSGDQGVQTLQVDTGRNMDVSTSGQALFQGTGGDVFKIMNDMITTLQTPIDPAANVTEAAASKAVYDAAFGVAITGLPTPTQAQIDAAKAIATDAETAAATDAATRAQTAHDTDYTRTDFTPGSTGALNQALAKAGKAIDAAMNNATTVQASVGSNVAELGALDNAGSAKDLQYSTTIDNLMGQGPNDFAKTVSELAQQQLMLQVAQKTFSTISSLSLLNFLK
jgi:flagellar hook-associated protein 3 FlgL